LWVFNRAAAKRLRNHFARHLINAAIAEIMIGGIMKSEDLKSMSIDDLWNLHQEVGAQLGQKLEAKKARLEERLRKIEMVEKIACLNQPRRRTRPVRPKYRNPKDPTETWSGRGKLPRWLDPQLRAGRRLDEFLIDRAFG
jgi:DNA-binding protein H-NS